MKSPIIVGVDIAKETFDAEWVADRIFAAQFENHESGFEEFLQWIPDNAHVVMEATGTYYLRLATFLSRQERKVSVVNPATPAYFARMKLKRAKTDPVDAQVLRLYGQYDELPLWRPVEDIFTELNQLDKHIAGLVGDLNRVNNRLEALSQYVNVNRFARLDLESQRDELQVRIKQSERELDRLVREYFGKLYTLLQSIRGIGRKTAVMLIVLTRAFTRFPSAKQFAAYVGITSFVRQSGTSVKGSGAITKMGHARMRALLYMAALAAKRKNQACHTFAARLTANGKPPKVVRIAVANKLIRQAFAVVEKQEPYSENFA